MKNDLVNAIKTKFRDLGNVYCIFKKDDKYAVSFNGTSETICVFDESFSWVEFCSFYDKKGGEISSSWKIVYKDE